METATAQRPSIRVDVTWMTSSHMDDVLEIETESFENPWTKREYGRRLRAKSCIGMVSEYDDRALGFMVYDLHGTGIVILNFAVHPEFRRQTVGRQMVAKLKAKLSPTGKRTYITTVVRETNVPAQLFFRSTGFRATMVVRGFYDDTNEDSYVMRYSVFDRGRWGQGNK